MYLNIAIRYINNTLFCFHTQYIYNKKKKKENKAVSKVIPNTVKRLIGLERQCSAPAAPITMIYKIRFCMF